MKPTDFSKYLTDYLTRYLPHERGASANTICSYRDTFIAYLTYMESNGIKAEKLSMVDITKTCTVSFLDWLEKEIKCSVSTRNLRLAAIHSFFKYVQYQNPDNIYEYQKIMSIGNKKAPKPAMNYLTVEGIRLLLQQPDITKARGRRNLALLSFMYDTGARVSEIINISPQCVRLNKPYTIIITGKGNKARVVPVLEEQLTILRTYMTENGLLLPENMQHPLFSNCWGEKLTRAGILNILGTYVKMARTADPTLIPENISCHSLRHSRAMHLLQAGVNLVYIRDILGHENIQTTEIYARADSKLKREAIEKAYSKVAPDTKVKPVWQGNGKLMDFLKSF
ncbi:MAG TPA: tyrosine-type recombinase/integrase [Puia sp.]|uniref:tyrosine-type recombinase/integrase n=1 Tax=Puia sp. TaxID=2045100 RepID=UPI002CC63068|nr:tyrosine-type recombinase/integrase [Puia sp.]HVU96788.1 tyrosine-type recombinase/integrase [Puia sp.]